MIRHGKLLWVSAALVMATGLPALAADSQAATGTAALDLKLPQQYQPFAPPAPAASANATATGAPVAIPHGAGTADSLNDTKPLVTGSLAAGVGYSKAFGTTNWEGANVNVTKLFGSVEHPVEVDIGISVARFHNLGNGRWPYSPYGPYGP